MILAIDTTLGACSVALVEETRVIAKDSEQRARGHAEALLPMIENLLAGAKRAATDIRGIVVTTGPGTFTGVRIGISAARGLALGLGVRIAGISTLEALALSPALSSEMAKARSPGAMILSAIDARRGELYVALYRIVEDGFPLQVLCPPARLPAADIAVWLEGGFDAHRAETPTDIAVIGSGAQIVAHLVPGIKLFDATAASDNPDVALLAACNDRLPAACWEKLPSPLYLRPPDATPSVLGPAARSDSPGALSSQAEPPGSR